MSTFNTPELPHTQASPATSGRAWHVAIHGQKQGPMDREALLAMMRARQVPTDSLVWTPGMPQWQPASAFPDFADALGVPLRAVQGQVSPSGGDDAIATIVPYRNSFALIGYYVSIGALIPVLGALLGPAAVFLGFKGLKARQVNPAIHGTAHAWVAIILGGTITLIHLGLLIFLVLGFTGVIK